MTAQIPSEADRLEALHSLGVRPAPEPEYDAICRTACALFDMPIAWVSLVDAEAQWFKARCGLDLDGTARGASFCTYTIRSDDLLVIEDATRDPRFASGPLVRGEVGVRFYAGAPLVLGPGLRLGALCVVDRVPRTFSERERAQLRDLAQVVMAQLRAGRAAREARESAASFRLLAESTSDMITRCDLQGTRLYVSPASETLLGYKPEELVGTKPRDLIHPDDAEAYGRLLGQVRCGAISRAVTQHRYRHKNGSWIWVEVSFGLARADEGERPAGYIAAVRDVSRRKEAEDRMAHMARHDPLTDLPNRLLFREELERALARLDRDGTGFALHCLDLDRFKSVNDTLGHQAGDTLLRVVAGRIRAVLRRGDVAARLGGDEFVIIQAGCEGPEDAARLAARVVEAMAAPVDLGGYPAGIGVSVGIALAPGDARAPDSLIARADAALYRAKAEGRNTWRFAATEEMPGTSALSEADPAGGAVGELWSRIASVPPDRAGSVLGCFEALLEATATTVWRAAADGTLIEGNGWDALTGQSREASRGDGWLAAVHPADRPRTLSTWRDIVAGREPRSLEYRVRRADGSYRWLLVRAVPLAGPDGRVREWVGSATDIHERRQADEVLRSREERLRLALQAGRMVAWEHDLRSGACSQSENAVEVLGSEAILGEGFLERVHPEDRETMQAFLREGGTRDSLEFRFQPPSGPQLWLRSCAERVGTDRIVGITFDITERKLAEEGAWRAANHDALTGLPNRKLFLQRLDEELAVVARDGGGLSLLLVDLDSLREINDAFGQDTGDGILVEVAARLRVGLRPTDMVARLGGDEFALLLTGRPGLDHAAAQAQAIVARLRQPVHYRGRSLSCRGSVGVAAYLEHDGQAQTLMTDATTALLRAKAQGRSRAVLFTPAMRAETESRTRIGGEVRAALAARQIVPFYQPKVCCWTGRISGFEALARWQHPTRGVLTPGYFGTAFEDPELATAIGDTLIRHVAADMRAWRDGGLDFGRVAVNVSSAEFRKPDLAGSILEVLAGYGVPTAQFELEVTETVFLGQGAESVPAVLNRLHDSGVLVTLDDFGTGFASLTHLKQFPVDHIKVDQSFVRNMEQDGDDAAIVAAVVGLGRSLGMHVTAEGVESAGQVERLRALGCDYAQGYHFAKPMAASRVPHFLRNWAAPAPDAVRLRSA